MKAIKHDRKVKCCNCDDNRLPENVLNLLRREAIRGKVDAMLREYDGEDYGDGVVLTWFENRLLEQQYKNDRFSDLQ